MPEGIILDADLEGLSNDNLIFLSKFNNGDFASDGGKLLTTIEIIVTMPDGVKVSFPAGLNIDEIRILIEKNSQMK